MRMGLMIGAPAEGNGVDGFIAEVKRAADEGFASVWTPQLMDADAARQHAAKAFAIYSHLPSYRAMLDREGAAGPADVAIVGSEADVAKGVEALADAGVTDFIGALFGNVEQQTRTRQLLLSMR
jgi:5,10-methylenetetrahydromethanopterin reductase